MKAVSFPQMRFPRIDAAQPKGSQRAAPRAAPQRAPAPKVQYRPGAAMTGEQDTMKLGDQSEQVRRLQQALQKHVPGLKTDGLFGPKTLAALKQAQGTGATGALNKKDFDQLTKDVPPPVAKPNLKPGGLPDQSRPGRPAARAKPEDPRTPQPLTDPKLAGQRPADARPPEQPVVDPKLAGQPKPGAAVRDIQSAPVKVDQLTGPARAAAERIERNVKAAQEKGAQLPEGFAPDGVITEQEFNRFEQLRGEAIAGKHGPKAQAEAIANQEAFFDLQQHFFKGSVASKIDTAKDGEGKVDSTFLAGGTPEKNWEDGKPIGNGDGQLTREELSAFQQEMQRRQQLQPDEPKWKTYGELARKLEAFVGAAPPAKPVRPAKPAELVEV